ncbi:Mur ligase family protein [Clostridium sp. C105KSO13]|uniref:Mur ligase family protein n=1 Tax=Clostridium sp. C105KSO13 TaxID=1776045 RepID=UPI0007405D49|nr:Mur ligase family protein [Clostridium sp. C105KSO13]CUX43555.1 UDP-N-acetylmuramate--L-alanine ligase [Clostridium sp. C105KSO13]
MRLRSVLAIKCAKCTSYLIKKLNRGSGVTLPGYVARLIDPQILGVMADMVREKTIVTMGTNGKTTTNSIIYHALKAEGKKVIINRTGANMLNGIISAFVLAADKHCRLDTDYACIEVDEIASVNVLPQLKPDCALLTNISRDQLDRFGEVDITFNKLKTAVTSVPDTKLIINCDDVLSYTLASESGNSFVTYGISEQIFDDISRSEIRESIFCRSCGKKLEYDFFHYGQLGIYHCPNCGLSRPEPDFTAENISLEEELYTFSMDGMLIHSTVRTPYNIYNTLSAYAALNVLGAARVHFQDMIEAFDYGNNRESIFFINDARVQLHLAKNPIGFQQKISLVLKDEKPKDIIIQINDTYQDGEDISWLWDVDFQYLADARAAAITTAGTRRFDMGLRLKYEDIPCGNTTDLRSTIVERTKSGTGNLYVIVNYSGLYSTNHMLTELEKIQKGEETP